MTLLHFLGMFAYSDVSITFYKDDNDRLSLLAD